MSFAQPRHEPPFYLLTQPISNWPSQGAANFTHPIIEYHFADDSPSALLPTSDTENVIIVDYEDIDSTPVVQSLHPNLAIAGVKVTAPGPAPPLRDGEPKRNDRMYIIETLSNTSGQNGPGESHDELDNPQQILAQFRERNALLRRVLDQPAVKPASLNLSPEAQPNQIP